MVLINGYDTSQGTNDVLLMDPYDVTRYRTSSILNNPMFGQWVSTVSWTN